MKKSLFLNNPLSTSTPMVHYKDDLIVTTPIPLIIGNRTVAGRGFEIGREE